VLVGVLGWVGWMVFTMVLVVVVGGSGVDVRGVVEVVCWVVELLVGVLFVSLCL